jgi:hypothetical protein
LSRSSSGLRHLRWSREVVATIEAHAAHNPLLAASEREALRDEAAALQASVDALSAAAKPYRDFLERTRVHYRARARVAAFLGESLGGKDARALAAAFEAESAAMEVTLRRPRKEALAAAKERLRAAMERMDTRLGELLSAAFVESLYPPLAGSGALVADDGDPDDDAAAAP